MSDETALTFLFAFIVALSVFVVMQANGVTEIHVIRYVGEFFDGVYDVISF